MLTRSRFYDIQAGKITFDDQDISTFDIAAYRKTLSLVSQEPTLYQGISCPTVILRLG
jgi:ABC-type multidrug transport system fused ATPase/permease subunit